MKENPTARFTAEAYPDGNCGLNIFVLHLCLSAVRGDFDNDSEKQKFIAQLIQSAKSTQPATKDKPLLENNNLNWEKDIKKYLIDQNDEKKLQHLQFALNAGLRTILNKEKKTETKSGEYLSDEDIRLLAKELNLNIKIIKKGENEEVTYSLSEEEESFSPMIIQHYEKGEYCDGLHYNLVVEGETKWLQPLVGKHNKTIEEKVAREKSFTGKTTVLAPLTNEKKDTKGSLVNKVGEQTNIAQDKKSIQKNSPIGFSGAIIDRERWKHYKGKQIADEKITSEKLEAEKIAAEKLAADNTQKTNYWIKWAELYNNNKDKIVNQIEKRINAHKEAYEDKSTLIEVTQFYDAFFREIDSAAMDYAIFCSDDKSERYKIYRETFESCLSNKEKLKEIQNTLNTAREFRKSYWTAFDAEYADQDTSASFKSNKNSYDFMDSHKKASMLTLETDVWGSNSQDESKILAAYERIKTIHLECLKGCETIDDKDIATQKAAYKKAFDKHLMLFLPTYQEKQKQETLWKTYWVNYKEEIKTYSYKPEDRIAAHKKLLMSDFTHGSIDQNDIDYLDKISSRGESSLDNYCKNFQEYYTNSKSRKKASLLDSYWEIYNKYYKTDSLIRKKSSEINDRELKSHEHAFQEAFGIECDQEFKNTLENILASDNKNKGLACDGLLEKYLPKLEFWSNYWSHFNNSGANLNIPNIRIDQHIKIHKAQKNGTISEEHFKKLDFIAGHLNASKDWNGYKISYMKYSKLDIREIDAKIQEIQTAGHWKFFHYSLGAKDFHLAKNRIDAHIASIGESSDKKAREFIQALDTIAYHIATTQKDQFEAGIKKAYQENYQKNFMRNGEEEHNKIIAEAEKINTKWNNSINENKETSNTPTTTGVKFDLLSDIQTQRRKATHNIKHIETHKDKNGKPCHKIDLGNGANILIYNNHMSLDILEDKKFKTQPNGAKTNELSDLAKAALTKMAHEAMAAVQAHIKANPAEDTAKLKTMWAKGNDDEVAFLKKCYIDKGYNFEDPSEDIEKQLKAGNTQTTEPPEDASEEEKMSELFSKFMKP